MILDSDMKTLANSSNATFKLVKRTISVASALTLLTPSLVLEEMSIPDLALSLSINMNFLAIPPILKPMNIFGHNVNFIEKLNKPYDEVLGAAQLIKRVKACKSFVSRAVSLKIFVLESHPSMSICCQKLSKALKVAYF